MVILLMGPPGSGKGTQAELICQHYAFEHVSTGDLIRAEIASDSEHAGAMRALINRGKLISNELIFALIINKVCDSSKNYLCDGFPRTHEQAVMLDDFLSLQGMKVDAAVNITVPDMVIVQRLSGRLTCRVCKSIYNVHYNPPLLPDVCDNCSSPLEKRTDDSADIVAARLADYHVQSMPILDYLGRKGGLFYVAGDRAPGDVFAEVEKILKKDH